MTTTSPPTTTAVAARAVGATKIYGEGETEVRALDDVDVEFERGAYTAIMGPSGSGKSTLLHCIAGLDTLTSGQVFLGDVDLSSLNEKKLTQVRRDRIGFIFQTYNLIPTLTAMENITLPMALAGRDGGNKEWVDRIVDTVEPALPAAPPAVGAVRRSAAARRRRPRAREPARDHLRRRAHGQPRLASGRGDPRVHAPGGTGLRPDDRDGDARPDRGRVRRTRHLPRRRSHRRRAPRANRPDAFSTRCTGWTVSAMWKVTRKGLAAHKLRFLLTALAVIIGVAFMAGTSVLTATIQQTFDDLFANIYQNTDAVVRSHEVLKSDFGTGQRPNVPASLVDVVRRTPTVDAAEGNVAGPYAQVVDKNGKAIGGNGPPTFGLGWDPNPKLNQFHILEGGRPPETADEIVIDRHTADAGNFKVGDRVTVLTSKEPRKYKVVGTAKFGTADSLAGASITLFTMPEAQRIGNSIGQYGEISVVAKSGVSQDEVAGRHPEDARRRRIRQEVRGDHRQGDHQGEPGRDQQAARVPQRLPHRLRGHRARSSARSSSTTRSRSWSRNGCGRWPCSARSAPAAGRCSPR